MEFKLITDSDLQEMSLKFLNLVSNINRSGENGQIISRQIGKSAFNQSDLTTLKQINLEIFSIIQSHIDVGLNQTPWVLHRQEDNLQPRIRAKPPPSFMAPTGTKSGLAKLIFNSEAASKHKKRQRKWWRWYGFPPQKIKCHMQIRDETGRARHYS